MSQIVCDNLVKIYKVADLEVVALQGLDLVVGTALGLGTAYLVEPGLDLAALAAGGRDVALRLDPVAPLLLAVGLLAVAACAIWATAAVVRRMSLSRSLRMGER